MLALLALAAKGPAIKDADRRLWDAAWRAAVVATVRDQQQLGDRCADMPSVMQVAVSLGGCVIALLRLTGCKD